MESSSREHPRLRQELLLILGLVLVMSPLIVLFNRSLDRRMSELKAAAVERLEAGLGRKVTYQRISPSLFGFLAIHGLQIQGAEDSQASLLRVQEVRIYYDLLKLLFHRNVMGSLKEIQVRNSTLRLDSSVDRELIELAARLSRGSPGTSPETLPAGLKCSGANLSLELRTPNYRLRLERVFFQVSGETKEYIFDIRGEAFMSREGGDAPLQFHSRLRASGSLERGFAWADLAVRIEEFTGSLLSLKRQAFQVTYREHVLEVRKIQDRSPLDLSLRYVFDTGEYSLDFRSERFRPSSSLSFSGALASFSPLLESTVTASGNLTYLGRPGTLSYRLDLQSEVPSSRMFPRVEVTTRLHGDKAVAYLEPLSVKFGQGSLEFYGSLVLSNLYPEGILRLADIPSFSGETMNAVLEVERSAQKLQFRGRRLLVGMTEFKDFLLELRPAARQLNFSLHTAIADADLPNSIDANGTLSLSQPLSLRAVASIESIPLNTVYRIVSPVRRYSPAMDRSLRRYVAGAKLRVDTDFRYLELETSPLSFMESGKPGNRGSLKLLVQKHRLQAQELRFDWEGYELTGSLDVDLSPAQPVLNAAFEFEGVPYQFSGTLIPGRSVRLEGSYGLRAVLFFGGEWGPEMGPELAFPEEAQPLQGMLFHLETEALPIPFKAGRILVSLSANGVYTRTGDLFLLSERTELRNLPIPKAPENRLAMELTLSRNRIRFRNIHYQDRVSSLSGKGEAVLALLVPLEGEIQLDLQAPDGGERYSLKGSAKSEQVQGSLQFRRSPLERLGTEPISGEASGELSLQGSVNNPSVHLSMELNSGRFNLDPLSCAFNLDYHTGLLALSSLNLTYLNHRIQEGTGAWDASRGEVSLVLPYRAEYFGNPVELSFEAQARMEPPASGARWFDPFVEDYKGEIHLRRIRVKDSLQPEWTLGFESYDRRLSFAGGPHGELKGQVGATGEFTLELAAPLPIQGLLEGTTRSGQIDASFAVARMDMALVHVLAQTEVFVFTAGSASGSLRISGNVNDPDYTGELTVRDGIMRFSLSPDLVRPINGLLVFAEKSFTMLPVKTMAGKARIEAEGVFTIDHWVPTAFQLTFRTDSVPGLWIRTTFGPIYADGNATGTVQVISDGTVIHVEGDLLVESCRFAVAQPTEEEEAEPVPLQVRMNLRTGRRVEFYWPSINFPIIRTYARQGEKVSLSVDGEAGTFAMRGEVVIRGGEIVYFDRSFYLKEGSIRFGETAGEFDPRVKALAELRERDSNNEDIRIYLEANNKLSQFSPRLYSVPSRSDAEIAGLVGGQLQERLEGSGLGVSTVLLTSDFVGQFGILAPFERAVRDLLGLDLFSMRTRFVQNLLLGKLLDPQAESAATNPLDNTTLSLGKYLGTDLFLEMLVRFQTQEVAAQESSGVKPIKTEGEINFEWTTPFFLLIWSFTPQHPERLFITDNSISFEWRYSY